MKPESIEYIYFNKHFEYLKETDSAKHSESLTTESKDEESKSSLQTIKHKNMSLLSLLSEFVGRKKSKSFNKN